MVVGSQGSLDFCNTMGCAGYDVYKLLQKRSKWVNDLVLITFYKPLIDINTVSFQSKKAMRWGGFHLFAYVEYGLTVILPCTDSANNQWTCRANRYKLWCVQNLVGDADCNYDMLGDVGWLEFGSMDQDGKPSRTSRHLVGCSLASWAPDVYKKLGVGGGCCVFTDMFYIVIGLIVIIATEGLPYWAPNIESMEVNSESNPLERKDAEGPSLDESLENKEHLDVDSCDSDSPKNV
ncbi:hypothetical protein Tco_1137667 [Tanacetum coccineum]